MAYKIYNTDNLYKAVTDWIYSSLGGPQGATDSGSIVDESATAALVRTTPGRIPAIHEDVIRAFRLVANKPVTPEPLGGVAKGAIVVGGLLVVAAVCVGMKLYLDEADSHEGDSKVTGDDVGGPARIYRVRVDPPPDEEYPFGSPDLDDSLKLPVSEWPPVKGPAVVAMAEGNSKAGEKLRAVLKEYAGSKEKDKQRVLEKAREIQRAIKDKIWPSRRYEDRALALPTKILGHPGDRNAERVLRDLNRYSMVLNEMGKTPRGDVASRIFKLYEVHLDKKTELPLPGGTDFTQKYKFRKKPRSESQNHGPKLYKLMRGKARDAFESIQKLAEDDPRWSEVITVAEKAVAAHGKLPRGVKKAYAVKFLPDILMLHKPFPIGYKVPGEGVLTADGKQQLRRLVRYNEGLDPNQVKKLLELYIEICEGDEMSFSEVSKLREEMYVNMEVERLRTRIGEVANSSMRREFGIALNMIVRQDIKHAAKLHRLALLEMRLYTHERSNP